MKYQRKLLRGAVAGATALGLICVASAVGAVEVHEVMLGGPENAMQISPAGLTLRAGVPVEMAIVNGSDRIHSFTAPGLSMAGSTEGFSVDRGAGMDSGWVSPRSPKHGSVSYVEGSRSLPTTWISTRSPTRFMAKRGEQKTEAIVTSTWMPARGPFAKHDGRSGPNGATALRPGDKIVWSFTPSESGDFELGCAINGHAATMKIPVKIL